MHKEKVSRREIGSLTVSKRFPSHQKITSPPNPPSLEPYYRKPLNFSILDDIGHGIKDHSTQLSRTGTLSRKGIKIATQSAGTMGRSTRVPEPIQPPVIPEGKLSAASSLSSLTSVRYQPGPGGSGIPTERDQWTRGSCGYPTAFICREVLISNMVSGSTLCL